MAQERENLKGWLWISPWLVGFLAFMLVPAGMSLYYSFTEYPLLEAPVWVGGENYGRMLRDDVFLTALWKTFVYGAISIPIATVIALVIAGLLNSSGGGSGKGVRGGRAYQAAVFLPTLVPMAASAMIWLWLFNAEHGLINRLLRMVGIDGPNWLTDTRWVMTAIVAMGLWGVGQAVVVYYAAMKEVPGHLYEAASIDGMGPVRRFVNVTMPMLSPVILFNVVTLIIGAMQVFVIPYIITKATPGGDPRAMYFYTMYMYDNAFVYGKMGYASAMAWVQLLVTLGLTGLTFAVGKKAVYYRAG